MPKTKKILFVDDDLINRMQYVDELRDIGYEVLVASTVIEAKGLVEKNTDIRAVIIDVGLPTGEEPDHDSLLGFEAGLDLARWIKEKSPRAQLIGWSASMSERVQTWFKVYGVGFLSKHDFPFPYEFGREAKRLLSRSSPIKNLRTFIVHGHDDSAKWELKNFLHNKLKLPEPIILHEQPSLGRTIIEKFEDETRQVDLVFVLLTPDDKFQATSESNEARHRARQNVIFEMGYFLGKLQRKRGRVFLLYKEPLDLPTDINGVIYIDISNGVDSAGETIRKELSALFERGTKKK